MPTGPSYTHCTANILATYKKHFGLNDQGDRIEALEVGAFMLYGSERVGSFNDTTTLLEREVEASISGGEVTTSKPSLTYEATLNPNRYRHEIGRRQYEVKNHLGNVLATVSDARIPHDAGTDGKIDYYTPVVKSAQDYYPFGMEMPGRKIYNDAYRYGFQGMEGDDEVKGTGNSYTTTFRQFDPRIGRWLSRDPLADQFPHQSPYIGMDNNPVYLVDPYGDSTIVSETDDEKYKVEDVRLDEDPDKRDKGVYKKGEDGLTKVGETVTTHSFVNENGEAVEDAIIDPNSTEGQDFIDNVKDEVPSVASYITSVMSGEDKYRFKSRGIEESSDFQLHRYRGSVTKDGKFASARDFGNMAAGIVFGRGGVPWPATRVAFDGFNSYTRGKVATEATVSKKAQRVGFEIGLKLRNKDLRRIFKNTPPPAGSRPGN